MLILKIKNMKNFENIYLSFLRKFLAQSCNRLTQNKQKNKGQKNFKEWSLNIYSKIFLLQKQKLIAKIQEYTRRMNDRNLY